MSAPENIWAIAYYCQNRSEHVRAWSEYGFEEKQQHEYTRTDMSQATVAAALVAAAGKCDALAAFRQKQLDDDEAKHWQDQDAILRRAWKMSISGLEAAATAIRALITPAQHDALAAHVAAEVAKAQAEDAAKIASIPPLVSTLIQFINVLADECEADLDDVVATVRIMPEGREVAEVSATVVIEKLQAALAQIGAKP